METRTQTGRLWPVPVSLIVTAAAIGVNMGGFWWGSEPAWWNVLATAFYLLFWCALRVRGRGTVARRMFLAFGMGTMLNGLTALAVVAWHFSWLTAPAMLLSLVFAAPLYGLDRVLNGDHTVFWAAVIALGALWTAAGSLPPRRK